MNTIQKRFILFLFFCLGIRVLFVYVAKKLKSYNNLSYLKVMGLILLVIGIGLFYSYFNYNKNDKGAFGGVVWWNSLRLLHGFNYLLFGLMALSNNKMLYSNAWIVLLVDVCIGLIAFLLQQGKSNNFVKIFNII